MMPRLGYEPGSSVLHSLNPITKLLLLICTLVLAVWVSEVSFQLLLLLAIILSFITAGLGPVILVRRARFVTMFSLLILLSYTFFVDIGDVLASLTIPIPLSDTGLSLTISTGGVEEGFIVALRFLNIILSSMLFVRVTDPTELAYMLMRAGVPYRIGFVLILALRFVPLFDLEFSQVQNAQRARGIALEGRGLRHLYRMVKYSFVPMLASTLSRVDMLSDSMEARGFGMYRKRTYLREARFGALDALLVVGLILLAAALFLDPLLLTNLAHGTEQLLMRGLGQTL